MDAEFNRMEAILKKNHKKQDNLSKRDNDWIYRESLKKSIFNLLMIWINDKALVECVCKIQKDDNESTKPFKEWNATKLDES